MGKHTNIFGWSKVAVPWKTAYETCNVGDDFSKVVEIAGKPDEEMNLGEITLYTYISEEWKGIARGGTVCRTMQFAVKDEKIVSKTGRNLDAFAG